MAYIYAWIWNNAGWTRFNVPKPPEYASKDGFVQYVKSKSPQAVLVLLTHDHGDHIGDYFEMLQALNAAGVPVKTGGQSDLMRKGLVPQFKSAGLDPAQIVLNGGGSMNFGGISKHGDMTVHLVPAIHSTLAGYPSAGFIVEIGGVRVYASGDTDLFGDMALIGKYSKVDLMLACIGDHFTMGPREAAYACQMLKPKVVVPMHFGTFPLLHGTPRDLEKHLDGMGIELKTMRPGETWG
jgi:L-ascorbate metabolism protein UlaG (beta-lactamase superfamily)